ncbi:MAG: hypothetical protein ACI4UV_12320, partial [Victivallales bacterium]
PRKTDRAQAKPHIETVTKCYYSLFPPSAYDSESLERIQIYEKIQLTEHIQASELGIGSDKQEIKSSTDQEPDQFFHRQKSRQNFLFRTLKRQLALRICRNTFRFASGRINDHIQQCGRGKFDDIARHGASELFAGNLCMASGLQTA